MDTALACQKIGKNNNKKKNNNHKPKTLIHVYKKKGKMSNFSSMFLFEDITVKTAVLVAPGFWVKQPF